MSQGPFFQTASTERRRRNSLNCARLDLLICRLPRVRVVNWASSALTFTSPSYLDPARLRLSARSTAEEAGSRPRAAVVHKRAGRRLIGFWFIVWIHLPVCRQRRHDTSCECCVRPAVPLVGEYGCGRIRVAEFARDRARAGISTPPYAAFTRSGKRRPIRTRFEESLES